jgi:hypothetical protein
MNKKQKIISIVAVVIIFLMGLVPPWKIITQDLGIYTVQPIGYSPIFLPPIVDLEIQEVEEEQQEQTAHYTINLDVTRLIVQWVTILFILAALLFITKEKVEEGEDEEIEEW